MYHASACLVSAKYEVDMQYQNTILIRIQFGIDHLLNLFHYHMFYMLFREFPKTLKVSPQPHHPVTAHSSSAATPAQTPA
jgi:hypothetical protein